MPLRFLLALLGGLCLWAAFPSINLWVLAPVGAGLWAVAVRDARPGQAFLVGTASGVGCFLPLLSWSGVDVGLAPWLALSVFESLYVGGAAVLFALATRGNRLPNWTHPLWAASAWVAGEFARATTPWGGFPWGRLAFSQADSPLAPLAALGGAPLLGFAVVLSGAGLTLAAVPRTAVLLAPTPPPGSPTSPPTAPAGAAASSGRWGQWGSGRAVAIAVPLALALTPFTIALLVPRPVAGPNVNVLLVQGNSPLEPPDTRAEPRVVLNNHVNATLQAASEIAIGRRAQPDLVTWPENASDIDPLRDAEAAAQITQAVRAIDAPVLVGAVLDEPADHLTNAALLYTPQGEELQRYDKRHPVPFAEYIPWRPFFRLLSDQVDRIRRDFVAGDRVGLLEVPLDMSLDTPGANGSGLPLGVSICFEVAHDDLVRDVVEAGAQLIVVQTNNATFGYSDESEQQLAISRIRAVEHSRSVVHNSTVGVSAMITPDGIAHDQTSLFTTDLISRDLPRRDQLTWATRLGRAPEVLISLAALTVALVGAWRRRA